MSELEAVDYSVNEGIATVLIDRPDVLNAFNNAVVKELGEVIDRADEAENVYAIILSGRGDAFCAGVDTEEVLGPAGKEGKLFNELRLRKVQQVIKALYNGTTPTIAAINGPAIGGGFGFTLACDFRIMSEDAFLRDQHANIGIPPGTPESWLLSQLIGESKAKEIVFASEDVSAAEAEDLGLVIEVSESGETLADARAFAEKLRDKPAVGLEAAKTMFNTNFSSMAEARETHNELHFECLQDPEHHEGLAAVRENREPDFDRDY